MFKLFIALIPFYWLAACKTPQKLAYFEGDLQSPEFAQVSDVEPVIQKGDILYISVSSANVAASAEFNMQNYNSAAPSATSLQSAPPGYVVDASGLVLFPVIGGLPAAGKTKKQFSEELTASLKKYLVDPVVLVRFLNYKVTVLGEVSRPGTFNIPGERVNILEALGLAGDITVFGKREKVLVIREQNGKRQFERIDLTKPDVFKSQFYNLQQNDVVYVETTNKKLRNQDQTTARDIGIGLSVLTTIALIINATK